MPWEYDNILDGDGGAINVDRLARALRAIHGDVIPLPDPKPAAEWAAIIADWYEDEGEPHPGPRLRAFYAAAAGEKEEKP